MNISPFGILVVSSAVLSFVCSQSDDGFTDENRPYKFGFNIEGYQHRYEEKDEKGIIMGEFGFITGDGVYHLTVYATDENGNFKILKMKNIKIGLPMERMMMAVQAQPGVKPKPVREMLEEMMKTTKPQGKPGCSGCLIPTTASPVKEPNGGKPPPIASGALTPGGNVKTETAPKKPATNAVGSYQKPTDKDRKPSDNSGFGPQQGSYKPDKGSGPIKSPGVSQIGVKDKADISKPANALSNVPGPRPQQNLSSGNAALPASKDEASKNAVGGMSMQDLMGLLYKFNYTLSYHGHHETGNRAGDKEGAYFFNGRDGFARDVKYIANEFGYQPNITLVELTAQDTPQEDTEKELNKLKGYEFKWFYSR